jgi:hypothetical protein
MAYLVEDLIESVKDRSFAPISQTTFTDVSILRLLNEELSLKLVADITSVREDFFLATKLTSIVANKDHYLVPRRAIGTAIKALFPVDSAGNVGPMLPRRDIDRIGGYSDGGVAEAFYFEADQVVIIPKPLSGIGSLMFSYPRKPNTLIATASCAKITAVTAGVSSVVFTVDTDLTASLVVGDEVDFLRGRNPYGLWAEECAITAIDATTITVALSDIADVDGATVLALIGDYICPAGFANIPMLPEEFSPGTRSDGHNPSALGTRSHGEMAVS